MWMLLLSACGGGVDEEAAPTTTTSATTTTQATTTTGATTTTETSSRPADLRITFDGEDCLYEGATELPPGPVQLVFVNASEGDAAVNMVEIDEGYTIQDVADDIEARPTGHHPPWTREVPGPWRTTRPGEQHQWDGELEPGLYAMGCVRMNPLRVWFGTGFTVES